jgi:hypothetical protein
MKKGERMRLDLTGLRAAPSQVVGAVRLVPLVRDEPIDELRLYTVPIAAGVTTVKLDERTQLTAYMPHALVFELPGEKYPQASLGTQLLGPRSNVASVQVLNRLARKEGHGRLRLLPQSLAIDAYLSVGFSGPNVAWPEYSREVLSHGLSPRAERVYQGDAVRGLDDALRVFELHPGQVGVLVFVADAFGGAFVAPRPEDYRRLHRTLLQNKYGELLVQYAVLHPEVGALWQRLDAGAIGSLDELASAMDAVRRQWSAFAGLMASGLVGAEFDARTVQRLGGFRLVRFLPSFHPHAENHVGEAILAADGRLAYLETYRLSASQARRGRLLATLVAKDWELEACATALEATREELVARLRNNGLGHLLKAHVR